MGIINKNFPKYMNRTLTVAAALAVVANSIRLGDEPAAEAAAPEMATDAAALEPAIEAAAPEMATDAAALEIPDEEESIAKEAELPAKEYELTEK